MRDNRAKAIKTPGILHNDSGLYKNGTATVIFSYSNGYDILAVLFENELQIAVAYLNIEKAVQLADTSFTLGRVNKDGYAMEQVSAVGSLVLGKDRYNAKDGTVFIAVSSNGKDKRMSVCFDNRVEIIVDLAPVLLLAQSARGAKLFS